MAVLQTLPSTKKSIVSILYTSRCAAWQGVRLLRHCDELYSYYGVLQSDRRGNKEAATLTASSQMFFSARRDDNRLADVARRPRIKLHRLFKSQRLLYSWFSNGDISALIMHIENRHGFHSFSFFFSFEHLWLNMQDFPNLLAGGMEQTPGVYARSSKSYPRLLGSSWCWEMKKKIKNKGRSLIYGIMPPKSSASRGRKEENECGETHSGGLYKQPAKLHCRVKSFRSGVWMYFAPGGLN